MDAKKYIKEVLSAAHKYGNNMLGSHCTYKQDGARPHINHLTQDWCANSDHFPDFISKDHWPPNSPNLCPLDYSLWNELAESMDRKNITRKATLTKEIKRSCKNIEKEKTLHSLLDCAA